MKKEPARKPEGGADPLRTRLGEKRGWKKGSAVSNTLEVSGKQTGNCGKVPT